VNETHGRREEKSEKKQKEAAEEERGQAERRPAGSEGQNENQKTKMPKKEFDRELRKLQWRYA
jgi:hypothetical protein